MRERERDLSPPKRERERDPAVIKNRQRVLNKFGFDRIGVEEEEDKEVVTEASEDDGYQTTTPYDASLNITLTNLNMTASEVIDRKNLTVPGIDTLFQGLGQEKAQVIYGAKKEDDSKKKKTKKRERTEFINTDFGGGGAKFRNSFSQGGLQYGGGNRAGGRMITNRRTSTTTRAPMTYFLSDGQPIGEESSMDLLAGKDHSLLDGDYEDVVDYDPYDYYYEHEPSEVPTGVKSALIASSVVGGLAVSIFLCIFMLCLWKQMKSKLRMSLEYEEPGKQGWMAGLCCQGGKGGKKEEGGYFNKAPPSEQHYSTTSSEEY